MAEYTGEYCYHIDVQACMAEYTGEYCYHIGVQACMAEYTGEYHSGAHLGMASLADWYWL